MRKNPSTHHPRWCDPRQCITGEHGARHTSRATRLLTGDQTFELTLVQHDPDGAPDLLIEVTDTADPDGLHVLTLPEIKALAETLLIEYLKAASFTTTSSATGHSGHAGPTMEVTRTRQLR